MFVLNFLKNIDIVTDPVVSVDFNMFGYDWINYVPPNDLAHSPGDIMIGFICSDTEIAATDEYPNMAAYPPPPSTLVHYAHVSRSGSGDFGGWHGVVGISMGTDTTFGITIAPGQQTPEAVALCLRCKNAPEWIDTLLNDVSTSESSAVTDRPFVREAFEADCLSSLLPIVIEGKHADIPGGLVTTDRTGCHAYLIESTPANVWLTIEPGVNLMVVIISSHWNDASPWLGSGTYTLTLNGVAATHYAFLDADRGVLVAYFKNPTSGVLAVTINNPHYGNELGEPDSDLFIAIQIKNADISGDPIRGLTGPASAYWPNITVSDISYVLGDMVVGVLSTDDYYSGPAIIGPYSYLAWAGDYFYDTEFPYTDWEQALTVGCTRIGGDSSIFMKAGEQAHLYAFALVIKCADPIGATLNGEDTGSVAADSVVAGSLALSDATSDSWGATDLSSSAKANPGGTDETSAISTIESGDRMGLEIDAAGVDTLSVEPTAYGSRTAAAFFGVHAILDVSEVISAWEVGFAAADDSVLLEEIHDGMRLVHGVAAEDQFPGDLLSSERFVDGVAAELLAGSDDPVATMVCWSFTADTSMVLDIPSAVAQMYPAVLEVLTIIDGYSAILIECYFPAEITATYDKVEYTAALEVPAVAASYARKEIEATYSATAVTASFTRKEIVAKYEPMIFAASKGE